MTTVNPISQQLMFYVKSWCSMSTINGLFQQLKLCQMSMLYMSRMNRFVSS